MIREDEITDDSPVPLALAARLFFPQGGITVKSLRNEARKGRLVLERIANKDFVTRRAINDMRRKCRLEPQAAPVAPFKPPAGYDPKAYLREIARRLKAGEPMPGEPPKPPAKVKPFKPKPTRIA